MKKKNIFLIYSGADKEQADKFKIELEQVDDTPVNAVFLENQAELPKNPYIKVLEHKDSNDESSNDGTNWKKRIKPKIKKSDIVIFIQGEHSIHSKHIKWEIKTALFLKKPVAVVQIKKYNLPKWILVKAGKEYSWEERFKLKNEIIAT